MAADLAVASLATAEDLAVVSPVTEEDLAVVSPVTEEALEDLEGSEATVADLEDSTLSRL